MKAIILAGGRRERLRPLTDKAPKPLLPIKGKPIVQWCVENLKRHGITEIILAIGYKADTITSYFKDGENLGVHLSYVVEKQPLGTGGAGKQAAHGIKEPFLLIWGDNLMNANITELIKMHQKHKPLITMTLTHREDVEHFGVAKLEGDKIVGFVEKPARVKAPSNLINAGAFVIDPKALDILPTGKSSIEKQCFEKLAPEGKVIAYKHTGYWLPTDTLDKYRYAQEHFSR